MGPIPFFLTFRAELKKVRIFEIRPKMTDSRGNLKKERRMVRLLLLRSSGKKIDFFVFEDILMGPIPFFLTFHAEFKKFIFFEIRPKMTDSRGNFTM